MPVNEMCPSNGICQNPITPNPSSDLDLDSDSDPHAAWAGIAVVIVVIAVGAGVWYGIRRRRRRQGGHNSVDVGDKRGLGFAFPRVLFFWRGSPPSSPEQPISAEGEMELGGQEPKDGRSSSASNLKRPTTSGTVDTVPPVAAKLATRQKEVDPEAGQYPMLPLHHPQLQSTETLTSIPEPLPSHDPSRDSTGSSHRSSLPRLSIPPPGLGPLIHQPDPTPDPSHSNPSTSQPQN